MALNRLLSPSSWWWLTRELLSGVLRHNLGQQAAALTFTSLLAIVPLITLALMLIAAVPGAQEWWQRAEVQLFSQLMPTAGDSVREHLDRFIVNAGGLRSVSLLALLFTVLGLARGMNHAFHEIWEADDRPSLRKALAVLVALLLAPLLVAASMALTSFLVALPLIREVDAALIPGGGIAAWAPYGLSVLAFALLYWLLPPGRAPRWCGAVAALVAAILFELAKRGFAIYVGMFPSYELVYGAFSAIPVFLIWLYLSWLIVLFGAELTRTLQSVAVEPQ